MEEFKPHPWLDEETKKLMVEWRRSVHQQPELEFDCHRTAEFAAQHLKQFGYTVRSNIAQSGLEATIKVPMSHGEQRKRAKGDAGRPKDAPACKTVAFRADMDGLPVNDQKDGCSYSSKVAGKMHACGHDGHVAMMLGAARIIAMHVGDVDDDQPHHVLKLLFQPAEEGGYGGREMARAGVLDDVDEVYGIHLWNLMNCGEVGVADGPVMAASDRFCVNVKGSGGHGGAPDGAKDAIVAAAHIVTATQTLVSRVCSPFDRAVVSIGTITGGYAPNVIADCVELRGTMRTYSVALRDKLQAQLDTLVQGVAHALGCQAELKFVEGYPATVNHPAQTETVRQAARKVAKTVEPTFFMGGEDFSFMLLKRPGCFFFIGSSPVPLPDQPVVAHHSSKFDIDERALNVGCSVWLQLFQDCLA